MIVSELSYAHHEQGWPESFVDSERYEAEKSDRLMPQDLKPGLVCTLRLVTGNQDPKIHALDLPDARIQELSDDKRYVSLVLGETKNSAGRSLELFFEICDDGILMDPNDCESSKDDEPRTEVGYLLPADDHNDDPGSKEGIIDWDGDLVALNGLLLVGASS